MGDHTRYWNDDDTRLKYDDFQSNLIYEKGLELSLFGSKRVAKQQSVQKKNQKSLIQRIYHQGGKQYEGDLEEVKTNSMIKSQEGKRTRTLNKETTTAGPDPNSLLDLFRQNAQMVSETPANLQKIRSLMVEEWTNALVEEWTKNLPLEVLHKSLQEAHAQGISNACEAGPYRQWLERGGPCGSGESNEQEDDECDQGDEQEESNSDGEDSYKEGNTDEEGSTDEEENIGEEGNTDEEENTNEEANEEANTDEEDSEEAWEGISNEQAISAQDGMDVEGDSPHSEQTANTQVGGSEPTMTPARDSLRVLEGETETISQRLRVLTEFKVGAELGLLGLHRRSNR